MVMTVREFFKRDFDTTEVFDNLLMGVDFFCHGPEELTEEGEKHFSDVLNLQIEIIEPELFSTFAVVMLDENFYFHGIELEKHAEKVKALFRAAGCECSEDERKKWFK